MLHLLPVLLHHNGCCLVQLTVSEMSKGGDGSKNVATLRWDSRWDKTAAFPQVREWQSQQCGKEDYWSALKITGISPET